MAHRKYLILPFIISFFLAIALYSNSLNNSSIQNTFSVDATSPSELKDELIIALFIDHITSASDGFYDQYFTMTPAIYNYEIKVQKISEELGKINITFGITPMLGAHDPVGYDEASYQIDSSGKKTLTSFMHLKSYDIPDHLKNLIKKELP